MHDPDAEEREAWREERAAIQEFDGGLSRWLADRLAKCAARRLFPMVGKEDDNGN